MIDYLFLGICLLCAILFAISLHLLIELHYEKASRKIYQEAYEDINKRYVQFLEERLI